MADRVIDRILAHSDQFTARQRRIAGMIVEKLEDAAFMSIQVLAKEASVSEASVVRFARKIGYEGYPELREALREALMQRWLSSQRLQSTLLDIEESGSIIRNAVERQIKYLRELLHTVTDEDVTECAEWIRQARRLLVWGEGSAAAPALTIAFWVSRFGVDARLINETGRNLFEHLASIGENDLIVAFAFRRESPEVRQMFEWGGEQGARRLLITDAPQWPMASVADKVLVVKRGPVGIYRSMSVPVLVADAIVVATARILGDQAIESLRRLDHLRNRYGFV